MRAADITDFRLHDTRHTFASRAMAGEDVLTVKASGGWKNLNMDARYARPSDEHRRAAVERLTEGSTPPP